MQESNSPSPTIKALDTTRQQENLAGSPLIKQKVLFGKEYDFYQDGSVLVVDPRNQTYHFLTAKGRERGRGLRENARQAVENDQRFKGMKLLGEGKGSFSKVYPMETDTGAVAVKTTDKAGFMMKELMEEATTKSTGQTDLETIVTERLSTRKIIQKMALRDTVRLLKRLEENGVKTPEFYGFTVRRDPQNDQIQEFQFMERIDRPTLQSIFEMVADRRQQGVKPPYEYNDFLNDLSDRYYGGDDNTLIKDIARSFHQFVVDTRRAIPGIADLEMDNIFLAGYNEESKRLEFLLIDPIEEQVYFRPLQSRHKINNKMNFTIIDDINYIKK